MWPKTKFCYFLFFGAFFEKVDVCIFLITILVDWLFVNIFISKNATQSHQLHC